MKDVIIMGAAIRDFHNFNVFFRNNKNYCVRAFTATQIPDIEDRKYPAELAGELYPDGIPIYPEEDLKNLIRESDIAEVYFSYSDVLHTYVMHLASEVEYDLVIGATPIDLGRLIQSNKKNLRVTYDLEEIGVPDLKEILTDN